MVYISDDFPYHYNNDAKLEGKLSKAYVKPVWYKQPVSLAAGLFGLLLVAFFLGRASAGGPGPAAAAASPSPEAQMTSLAKPLGSDTAKLTIIEYADYQCPYCSKFNLEEMPLIKKDFIDTGKVRFEFRNAPFLGNESLKSAEAGYCANDQGKYWEYHDELYRVTAAKNGDETHPVLDKGIFSADNLIQYAQDAGLDRASFTSCFESGKYQGRVASEAVSAQAAGVQGTPMFFIGSQHFSGLQSYSILKSLIESQL